MNISKLIFALIFTLGFTFNSFATNVNTIKDVNEFTTTFSTKINNQATANIQNNQGTVIVTLTNEQGNILQERTITSENIKYTISLESLPKGTYFLQVRGEEKSSYETYYVN
ncbi:Protein of unknown function (DUF3244) [Bernardetia litoralis DSM 6794]|uniref:Secretion system C-terminal sorting domain-containing protein n=1 Tax=Bernardetia litoralis (strain ATCC 23117 / DSM 6794 / NBRC 15988 / NCIMB 1366 / Fx l1 / Sio-4) TaxID=880071 RepID=I4AMN8_BERLS|nr:DUF3244 domain-containing protein [Bernardetia litoralis]AFM05223.1 Protein of unknown function (DUF3244) [Bernardetia litoralis DSM 6794]